MDSGRDDYEGCAVVVDDLQIRYGDTLAVAGVSFGAKRSEVTVLLGPNGAGKTSTVEHLEGFRKSSGGSARVLGLDPIQDQRRLAPRVGLMLQQGGIPTAIRPIEVLRQYSGFYANPADPAQLLALVGLTDRSRTAYRHLSGGEKQRLSLALALIGRPEVVFLDEPTAGVDLAGRDMIRNVVVGLRNEGVCVVLTTHDLDDAERLADSVVIVDHGRVVAQGSPADLVKGYSSDELLFSTSAGLDVRAMSADLGVPVVETSPGEYRIAMPADPALVASVTSWLAKHQLQLRDLRAERVRLDDVFRRLTSIDHNGEAETI